MKDKKCVQCGEWESAIRRDEIYCGIMDHEGECEVEWNRHRFKPYSDKEQVEMDQEVSMRNY